jgi:hypothetical protein
MPAIATEVTPVVALVVPTVEVPANVAVLCQAVNLSLAVLGVTAKNQ